MEDLPKFILNLPQIVPESWCLECRVCCRFPDTRNVQTPFWSGLEAGWAQRKLPEAQAWFRPEPSSPSLSARLMGCAESGYRCPAFEPGTNRCRIHEVKPLDCRLYPFVLASNPGRTQVLLAMDSKCPFIERHGGDPELAAYAAGLVEYLDTEVGMDYLERNPNVVGPSWPEYLWVGALPRATARIPTERKQESPHPALRALREEDLPMFSEALRAAPHAASHYTLASILGWGDLLRPWWAPLDGGGVALFSEQAGSFFMPVPPLGKPDAGQVRQAWEILEQANREAAGVSRIEGIEESALPLFGETGFSIERSESEYLYSLSALAGLRGDDYRSQRWAINRCAKSIPFRIRPFERADLVPSLQLYTRWAIHRQKTAGGAAERRLLRDSLFYHRRLMMDHERMGLWGRVLESEGRVLAYTFGGPVSADTFCVFAEIADRRVPGLAQTLFRELCREAEKEGFRWLNAMGDSGLPALRRAKLAYRPAKELPVFTAAKKQMELRGIEPLASTVRL